MTITCCDAKEWPPNSNNGQDAAYSEKREEAIRRLRLLFTRREIPYMNQKVKNFEFLRNNITSDNFR